MLSNSILESPNFQNFLWEHATRPPSCNILCMQVLLHNIGINYAFYSYLKILVRARG